MDNSLLTNLTTVKPRRSIEIIFHDIDPSDVEDVNVSFRDSTPYVTVTERTDGSYVVKSTPYETKEEK